MRANEIRVCSSCYSRHLGNCGGLSFRDRLRTIRLDTSVTPSRTKRSYYDEQALTDMFGEDKASRQERYMDETKGRGAVSRSEMDKLSPAELDFYTGADLEEDGDAPF